MNIAKHSSISFSEALDFVRAAASARMLSIERVPVALAAGRVLAQPLIAEQPLPGFDNSAMDGFAVRADDLDPQAPSHLALVAEQFAGIDLRLELPPGSAIRITTGAPLPAGADTVVIKENATLSGASVSLAPGTERGANIRRRGEDMAVGESAIAAGTHLNATQASLAAALGCAELSVWRRPRVAVFSTGDELRQPGEPLAPGTLYDSNAPLLNSLLAGKGITAARSTHLADAPATMRAALLEAAANCDVILTCGGVSAGEKDYLPALVAGLGEVIFWKVRIKPGMPVLFGRVGNALILALPGNPVAVLATFRTLVETLLHSLQRMAVEPGRWFARLDEPLLKTHGRLEFQRGHLHCDGSGTLWVNPDSATGSNRLAAAARANTLIVVPEGPQQLQRGAVLEVLPLPGND